MNPKNLSAVRLAYLKFQMFYSVFVLVVYVVTPLEESKNSMFPRNRQLRREKSRPLVASLTSLTPWTKPASTQSPTVSPWGENRAWHWAIALLYHCGWSLDLLKACGSVRLCLHQMRASVLVLLGVKGPSCKLLPLIWKAHSACALDSLAVNEVLPAAVLLKSV